MDRQIRKLKVQIMELRYKRNELLDEMEYMNTHQRKRAVAEVDRINDTINELKFDIREARKYN